LGSFGQITFRSAAIKQGAYIAPSSQVWLPAAAGELFGAGAWRAGSGAQAKSLVSVGADHQRRT